MSEKIQIFLLGMLLIVSCNEKKEISQDYNHFFDTERFVGKHKAEVSVLGTFHFTNSVPHDYEDQHTVDVLSKERQIELNLLLDKITKFQPSKIFIERNRISSDSLISDQYDKYLNEEFGLSENDEVYQIAFQLGKRLGHDKIYCSDARADWLGVDLDWENFDEAAYLKLKGQYEKSNRYNYDKYYEIEDSLKSILTLSEYLALINDPNNALFNHQIYLTESVLSGAGDHYLGADSVTRWYRRNLRIFANILDLTDFEKEEKLLIIYGASHIWTLKQFFKDSPDFKYTEINQFLRE